MNLIESFTQSRPTTNLTPDAKYSLPKAAQRTGFMGIFTKKYGGDPRKSLMKVAIGAVMDARGISLGKPAKAETEEDAVKQKQAKKSLRDWESNREGNFYKLTSLRKVNGSDPHFILNLPMFSFVSGDAGFAYILSLFSPVPLTPEARQELQTFANSSISQLFPAKLAIGNAHVGRDLEEMLNQCLIGVRYESKNGNCLVSLEFKISKADAEHLVSTDWIEIRPIDLYPLLSTWAAAEYIPKFYGKTSVSISKIASTLPKHEEADQRIDQYGVSISPDGSPIYLPAALNNTEKYESLFSNAGANADGSFSLAVLDPEETKNKRLPANIPVLVDWINFKFSYTNTAGRIEILSLEHYRRCNASMAVNLIRKKRVDLKMVNSWVRFARLAGVSLNGYVKPEDFADVGIADDPYNSIRELLSRNQTAEVGALIIAIQNRFERGYISDRYAPAGIDFCADKGPFAFVNRFLIALHEGMVNNLEALYVEYAVSTITAALGYITLFATYGRSFDTTRLESDTHNKAALDQGVDPNWTPPSAPLLTKKFQDENGGLLPHQFKVRNILKDRPDLAVLPISAGGGKSMLAITDVLYEIKEGKGAPYLIMCPSHLVANYVSEVVEFTEGAVNVLPITTYNIRTTGYERFEQIMEKAPINTVLIVDYNALKYRARATVYGTTATLIYPVVEFIRKFRPGYVFLDESHFLKNPKSTRYHSVMSLIADVPKKRIASGTLNPDSPSDLPGQMAILDPTIFGTRDEFNQEFGKVVSGNRVSEWKPNAGIEAIQRIKQNAVWAAAKRKEWACALPPRNDQFVYVSLSDRQKEVYDAIFDEMVQSIKKKAQSDKNAKRLLDSLEGKKASQEEEEDFGDMSDMKEGAESEDDLLDDEGDIGSSLQPYLAGIEQFVSDPSSHPYALNGFVRADGTRIAPLTGDDLHSPKAVALAQRLKEWFAENNTKAIVFVNYHNSANALYNAMPPELQASGFVYQASQKVEMINRFKTDPKVKWMIGIRQSLEVGLNLQQAGYLARIEGVWTPGEQEQGDSRIERPYFGPGGDKRPKLQFDTIVCDKTIDVTKAARLRAKMVAIAKFENATDPNYQDIPSIPVFKMTLDNITTQNDFNTNLARYQASMHMLNEVIKNENAEYKARLEAEGGFKFTQVERAPNPPDAKILARVPYAQGTELYSASNLGLVRLDNFLGTEMRNEDEEEGEDTEETEKEDSLGTDPRSESIKQQLNTILGLRCHTEYGEGEIVAGAAGGAAFINRVRVRLDDGTTVRNLRSTNVFVITRTETNNLDMRSALAKAAGLNVTEKITVPGNNLITKMTKKTMRELEQKKQVEVEKQKKVEQEKKTAQLQVELNLTILNGYMRISYENDDPKATKALEALGFRMDNKYVYTRILNYKHLINQAKVWAEAGFTTTKDVDNDAFQILTQELATNALRTHKHYTQMIGNNFPNYLRKVFKPVADKKALTMFALVTDGGEYQGKAQSYGMAYLCLPYGSGFPATREAIKNQYRRPATKWIISEHSLSMFVSNMDAVKKVFRNLKDAGIQIANIKDLENQAKSVKKIKPKTDKSIDLT